MKTARLPAAGSHPHVLITRHGKVKITASGRRANHITIASDGRYRMRRPRNEQEKEVASAMARIRAVADAPDFWYAAMQLPGSALAQYRKPGRPADHPEWLYLLLAAVTSIVGTQRYAITTISDPVMWRLLRDFTDDNRYRKHLGLAPLGERPPARHHLKHFQKKWTSARYRPVAIAAKRAALGIAHTAAKQQGLLTEQRPIDFDQPDTAQWVHFDGTVFKPVSTSRPGKDGIPVGRVDPAANYHHIGGETRSREYGPKVVFASARTTDYHGRIILDFEHAVGNTTTGTGSESAVTMAISARLHEVFPQMHGIIVDSVIRGQDVVTLAARGLLVVNYPHALSNPNKSTGGRLADGRVEKGAKVHTLRHHRPSGGACVHHIHVSGTTYHEVVLDARGKEVQQHLNVTNLQQRRNNDGTVRWYHQLAVPCQHGNQIIRVPLFHNPRVTKKKTPNEPASGTVHMNNRGELFRAFPVNTAMFQLLYGRRNDTESLHNQLKRYMRRMPAYGAPAQSLYILGLVIAHNALSRAHHLKRHGQPNPLDATT